MARLNSSQIPQPLPRVGLRGNVPDSDPPRRTCSNQLDPAGAERNASYGGGMNQCW
jgi:hypothetical protein